MFGVRPGLETSLSLKRLHLILWMIYMLYMITVVLIDW